MKKSAKTACASCGRFPLSRDEVGISKKLFGRDVIDCYCIDCIAAHFEVTPEEIEERIQMFKEEGCVLFQ